MQRKIFTKLNPITIIAIGALSFTQVYAKEELTVSLATIEEVVQSLASDDMEGRKVHQAGGQKARNYLKNWLSQQGLVPAGDDGGFEQVSDVGVNLVAILHPEKQTSAPHLLLSAHYDHVGRDCKPHPKAKSSVCNGAADNAAGVGAVLAAVEALKGKINAPIAVILWDHEEGGRHGSQYFAKNPSFPTDDLKLMINLDIIGLNLFKGLESLHLAVGAETGGDQLKADITSLLADRLDLQHLSYAFGHKRSDITSFVTADHPLPFVFFTDGDGQLYHTTGDELDYLNMDKVHEVSTLTATLAHFVLTNNRQYVYQKPEILDDNVLPIFEDAAALKHILERLKQSTTQNQLSEIHLKALNENLLRLNKIIAAGNDIQYFDRLFLGKVVRQIRALSSVLPFIP